VFALTCAVGLLASKSHYYYYYYYYYLLTAIGLSPGGSSPTIVQLKIKIHKTTTKHKKT
jgi:hypothetical protein